MKLFFSWQSDRPTITGRNLIERALKDAVKAIAADVDTSAGIQEYEVIGVDARRKLYG